MPEQLFAQIDDFLHRHQENSSLAFIIPPMQLALQTCRDISAMLRSQESNWAGAVAYDYLRMMALLTLGHAWCRMAAVALLRIDDAFYASKLALAQFFAARLLPQIQALACGIRAGDVGLDHDAVFQGEA